MNSWTLLVPMPHKVDSICRKVSDSTRWPAIYPFIIHCGTESAWFAPPNLLTESYTWFLTRTQPNSLFLTPKSIPYLINYRIIPCLITLVGSLRYLSSLLKHSLFCYILEHYTTFYTAELYTILTLGLVMPYLKKNPNFKTFLSYMQY